NWFNEREENLVGAIAGAVAAAVRQVFLFVDLEEVNRLSERLNSTTFEKVQDVVELVHQSATQLMDTNNMYIALYDDYSDTVRFSLFYEGGKKFNVETDIRLRPRQAGKGKTEAIIRSKEPLFHPTKEDHIAWYKQEGNQDYIKDVKMASWIGVPMLVNDKVIGVVATYHPTADYVYSRDDLASLQIMANQAAIAISNVRLAQQRKLREMGQLLSAQIYLPESELLEILYTQTKELMNAEYMYIALYDQATDMIRFGFAMRPEGRVDVERNEKWKPRRAKDGKGKTEWIVNNQKPLFHPTVREGNEWYKKAGFEPATGSSDGSWVGVPMLTQQGNVVGVISVSHPGEETKDEDGEIIGYTNEYLYDSHDLQLLETLAKAAANALENARRYREAQASQELGTLGTAMGAIQHRINNTLNIVSPNVERLRKRVDPTDGEISEILDIIDRNVHYTSQIIHRIQEALRGEQQTTNLNGILQEVANQASAQWRADTGIADIVVTTNLDDAVPLFKGSSGQIYEVFTNLTNNAYRAMPEGGKLNIISKLDGNMILVRVIDTGSGIPNKILSRLFERPVPSKEAGGTSGLGLFLGSLIVQSLGGSLKVEKTGAEGTTMLVQFPVPRS
ncbi:MAG: GAF domain-containing sensor histidine kinase, partial [Anaerolineae bacterium]|nr:GAF domain-containing sensor histidine kinase [Anaerolineae bacterium]